MYCVRVGAYSFIKPIVDRLVDVMYSFESDNDRIACYALTLPACSPLDSARSRKRSMFRRRPARFPPVSKISCKRTSRADSLLPSEQAAPHNEYDHLCASYHRRARCWLAEEGSSSGARICYFPLSGTRVRCSSHSHPPLALGIMCVRVVVWV